MQEQIEDTEEQQEEEEPKEDQEESEEDKEEEIEEPKENSIIRKGSDLEPSGNLMPSKNDFLGGFL